MARTTYNPKYDKSWGLVVGINDYDHASPLQYACNDAKAVAERLTGRFKFPEKNVVVLLDKDATLATIRGELHKLSRVTGEDDRAVVFYAGHGHTLPAYGKEAGFLVPVDGTAEDTSTLLPWDDMFSTSRLIPAKHMLFIMDACYGGMMGMRALSPGSKRFIRDMLSRYSRQFLAGGKADEVVADGGGPRVGHSMFTGHLLNALDGGLEAPDGVVSANALMAHVYDRVSKDAQSLQTPHYGFLAGDGDLFLAVPEVNTGASDPIDTDDRLIAVPADLTAPNEVTMTPPLLDEVKEYLPDPRHRIRLNDLLLRELRASQQRLGEEHFAVQGTAPSGEDFAARLQKYETAAADLVRMSVLLGRWAEEDQQGAIRLVMNVLAGQLGSKSGLTLWLAMRAYPMLLVMYAAGIAAIEGGNYRNLNTLFTTDARDASGARSTTVLQLTVDSMNDVNRMNAFKAIPAFAQKHTPQSEYLFTRMQPVVEDILFLGSRYERLFDRFEVLYALCYADLSDGDWGHPGRFAWKARHAGSDNPFALILEEAKREGDAWAPLRAGMFQGTYLHFNEVAQRFTNRVLGNLRW